MTHRLRISVIRGRPGRGLRGGDPMESAQICWSRWGIRTQGWASDGRWPRCRGWRLQMSRDSLTPDAAMAIRCVVIAAGRRRGIDARLRDLVRRDVAAAGRQRYGHHHCWQLRLRHRLRRRQQGARQWHRTTPSTPTAPAARPTSAAARATSASPRRRQHHQRQRQQQLRRRHRLPEQRERCFRQLQHRHRRTGPQPSASPWPRR